jgi:hypothetical protein
MSVIQEMNFLNAFIRPMDSNINCKMLLEDDFFSLSRLAAVWVVSDIIIPGQRPGQKRQEGDIFPE